MIRPSLVKRTSYGTFNTYGKDIVPKDYVPKTKDFAIITMPTETVSSETIRGSAAIEELGFWHPIEVDFNFSIGQLSISPTIPKYYNQIAFPVDPAMTRQDIEGATRIYTNSTNTGWLFAHAHAEDHHERVILLETIMHTLFEDLVHSKLEGVLKAVVGSDNPSPQIGTELLYTYNAQSGQLANYSNLIDFRKECIKWCSEVEKLLHIGQHVQENNHYLQHQLVRAIEQAKLIWNADTGKKSILASIASEVNAIIARVETDHEIETRWAKAKRIADAEAARKAAEAAANENEGGNGNG